MLDILSIRYVAAQKLCVVVDSPVKIWSCTLSRKKCHPVLTILCLSHYLGTIITIFAKYKYSHDFDKSGITLRSSRNEEFWHVLILNAKIHLSFFGARNLIAVEGLLCFFPYKNLICYLISDWKKYISNLQHANCHKLTELFLVNFLINIKKD